MSDGDSVVALENHPMKSRPDAFGHAGNLLGSKVLVFEAMKVCLEFKSPSA